MQNASQLREFGNEKAKVTIDIIKRLIIISGDQQSVLECERNVKDFLPTYVPVHSTISRDTSGICTMCMCEFDSPYSLQQCGHIFCRSCLISYFESSTMTTDTLKLCCPSNRCGLTCLIRDIISILGSEKINRLARIAFERHIRNSENDLVQCSGDNCNQVIEFIISNLLFSFSFSF
jgi:ATP-dependent RNA helicase DHX8/PRP22